MVKARTRQKNDEQGAGSAAPARSALGMLLDGSTSIEMRTMMMRQMCADGHEEIQAILQAVLEAASTTCTEETLAEQKKKLDEFIAQLRAGALRAGTFLSTTEALGRGPRASVQLPDGGAMSCLIGSPELAGELRCGDTVWLDAEGKMILFRDPAPPAIGEEAQLERQLADGRVEVTLREQGRFVFRAAAALSDQIEDGEVEPGHDVLVCPQRRIAFHAVPPVDGPSRYRFVSDEPVPDVVAARDIGAPSPILRKLERHLERELERPQAGARYLLRRSRAVFLTGVSGSGKTLTIHAFWNSMYSIASKFIGVPVASLPPRVLRFRPATVLSKWLGDTDKLIDRFFTELEELASTPFIAPDGRAFELPTLAVFEEADGLGRERGEEAIYDRLQNTLLERLDPARSALANKLIYCLFSTNVPQLLDPAFLRRAGAHIERFGRLDRAAFVAVLGKHLARRPFSTAGAANDEAARAQAIRDLTAWLYSPNGPDKGQLELTLVGSAHPTVKYRRDFLTGALIDRAVQDACELACEAEDDGLVDDPGLTGALLMTTLATQIRNVVELVEPRNAASYLTLPDNTRVATVRRLAQPEVHHLDLEHAS